MPVSSAICFGFIGVSMRQAKIRSRVWPCFQHPLSSFRVYPSPLDRGVTMETALPIVQAYRQYSVRGASPHSRRQTQIASMIDCSDHPSQVRKTATEASYSLGEFRPDLNGHGLVARATAQVDLNLGSLSRRSSIRAHSSWVSSAAGRTSNRWPPTT